MAVGNGKVTSKMESFNSSVNALHTAFQEVSGRNTPLMPAWERGWLEAANAGLTPRDVRLVYKHRERAIKTGDRKPQCLSLRTWLRDDLEIADLVDEAFMLRAKMRQKQVHSGKAEVMRATGRPVELEQKEPQHVGDLELVKKLKEAAG